MITKNPARCERKDLPFDMKAVGDDGTFEGYLSVYDVVDLGNDQVVKGAFEKTIADNKGVVPLLWNHDDSSPIGALTLADDDHGLKVQGRMFIQSSPKAAEIHAAAKEFHDIGRPMGLSIGYEPIQKSLDKGVRMLKEVKLWEGSMTLFPMLPQANLTSIKSKSKSRRAKSGTNENFTEAMQELQMRALRYHMIDALDAKLCDSLSAESSQEIVQKTAESIELFRAAYMEFIPQYVAMVEELGDDGAYVRYMAAVKAGRRNSSADAAVIKDVISQLQALLTDEAAEPPEPGDKSTSVGAAATTAKEPGNHSELESRITAMRSLIPASGKSQIH